MALVKECVESKKTEGMCIIGSVADRKIAKIRLFIIINFIVEIQHHAHLLLAMNHNHDI